MTTPLLPDRWRSVLYAPAIRPDLVRKLPRSQPDVAVVDLEGTVAPGAKGEAREHLRSLLPELSGQVPVLVRVNRVDGPWFEADLAAVARLPCRGVLIPRVERLADIDRALDLLLDAGAPKLPLGIGLESALGVADARMLLEHPRVQVTYFGAEDFVADMGGVRTPSNHEVAYARARVVLCARACRVFAFDQIVADFHDDEAFVREVREARELGYDGKACIHPRQVPLAQAGFRPSANELERAARIVAAYDAAAVRGVASVAVDGQLVDEPVAERARRLIARNHPPDCSG